MIIVLSTILFFAVKHVYDPPARRPDNFGNPHLAANDITVGPGEYISAFLRLSTGSLYDPDGHKLTAPDSFVQVAGGAHHMMAVTVGGNVYGWGDNSNGQLGLGNTTSQNNPTRSTVDTFGNAFGNVKKVWCGGYQGWNSMALKKDGTLWRCGDLKGGNRGNNTFGSEVHVWVQIPFPAGTFLVDALCSDYGLALDSAGNAWTWGAEAENSGFFTPYILAQGTSTPNPRNPTKLLWPTARVKQIAGGFGNLSYLLQTDGKVYAWGPYLDYAGLSNNQDLSTNGYNGWRVDTALNHYLTASIDTLVVNSMFTYVIQTDSTLWGWGSNACSNLGLGPGIDMRHYRGTGGYSPYNWDQGQHEAMIIHPTQVMVGKHNFTKIFGGTSINFWFTAMDVHDSIYVAGRDKGDVTGNKVAGIDSVAGNLIAQYPNGWDVTRWRYINPFRGGFIVRTTCILFKDTTGAILQGTYPLNTTGAAPTCFAGSDQNITLSYTNLPGSWATTSPGKGLYSVFWQCTVKPIGAPAPTMPLVANDTVSVSGLQTGTYTFSYTITDNNFKTNTATVNINVGTAPPPTNFPGLIRRKYIHHKYLRG